jgi:hypothetical protein
MILRPMFIFAFGKLIILQSKRKHTYNKHRLVNSCGFVIRYFFSILALLKQSIDHELFRF